MSFNLSQTEAIGHMNGPMLVLAGPGSGKTLVITERTKNLILNQGVNPSQILVITFTKAAATEMKERFIRLMGGKKYPITFGTFHAVFFSILKHAYGFNAQNIIREEQRYQFMGEIITKMHLEYEDQKEFINDLLGEISMVKNTGILLEHYYSANCGKEIFEQIYRAYDTKLKQSRLIDFDDMLVYCYELFDQRKDILSAWQQKYQYILIDEFQDINKIQFDIIKMLAKPEDNLFIVGDDDQSIYRFRGAKPELMLGFEQSYPKAKRVLLDVNYRSQKQIVAASLRLIAHNEQRFDKIIHANQKESQNIHYENHETPKEEGVSIIQDILKESQGGRSYEEIAILFRTNTQPRLFMEQLMSYNIPFRTRDNIPNLYEHWITRDILTYVRLALGSRERKDILQIMNRPKRYITRESVDNSQIEFEKWAEYFYERKQPWVAERIEQLEADLRVICRISPYAAINYIRMGIGYEEYLQEYAQYRRINGENLIEVLDELQDASREYKTYDAWFLHMEEYTKELQNQKRQRESQEQCVTLATLHSSKGLEYPIVHMLDVNEGIMPYKKAILDADIQEERRMFYVGITRAKEKLFIHSVKKYNGKEMDISRFIEEMQM
ncbi:MAG: ATP-dependent helicase [Lachnospiraceae bacterium]